MMSLEPGRDGGVRLRRGGRERRWAEEPNTDSGEEEYELTLFANNSIPQLTMSIWCFVQTYWASADFSHFLQYCNFHIDHVTLTTGFYFDSVIDSYAFPQDERKFHCSLCDWEGQKEGVSRTGHDNSKSVSYLIVLFFMLLLFLFWLAAGTVAPDRCLAW